MKIGIDARLWNETGVGRYIRNLVSELAKLDKKNDYVLFLRKKEFDTLPLPQKNFVKVLADLRWHSLDEQLKYPGILYKQKLDLMHFPYFSVPLFYANAYVVTIHDLIINHYPTGEASTLPFFLYKMKYLGYDYVLQKTVRRAKRIIAVSEATKKEILDHLPAKGGKISVIYEGVD